VTVFAALALARAPADSNVTLVAGLLGVLGGLALSLLARGASFRLMAAEAAVTPESGLRAAASRVVAAAAGAPAPTALAAAEVRRLASLAWAVLPTFPLPLFAVPKAVQLALLTPALALDRNATVASAFERTLALTRSRLRPLALAYCAIGAVHFVTAALWLIALLQLAPGLPAALLPQPLPAPEELAGALVLHFGSGTAFARVFEAGAAAERAALAAGLAAAAAQRWAATASLRALAFAAYSAAGSLGPLPVTVGPLGRAWERARAAAAAAAERARAVAGKRLRQLWSPGGVGGSAVD
jgi:hypothetical protein